MGADERGPMPEIPANHIPVAQEALYRGIVIPAVRREFHRVRARLDGPAPHPADGPLVVYLTHASWWDAYMLFVIYYKLLGGGFQNYIMMEAKQLRAYRFFAWCGAFSVDRHVPGDSERAVGYAAARLRERRDRCLWLFPQGRILPADRRPLVAFPGIARVVRQAGGATLWPVALRYEFRGEQQPEALIRCGEAHYVGGEAGEQEIMDEVGARLTRAADGLRDDALAGAVAGEEYRVLLRGREGINRWFDQLPGRRRPGAR